MKNKKYRAFAALSFAFLTSAALAGCSSADGGTLVLKALNCEDYIGEDGFEFSVEDEEGNVTTYSYDDVLSGFEQYESEKLGKRVRVIYDTYDTNETMLASLKTGKTTYDLIAASDYAVQKMMSLDMLQKIDRSRVPNYNDYCSPYLLNIMESITAPINGVDERMADYSVGYMWGTLGILYNPARVSTQTGVDEDTVKFDMQNWDSLWDPRYRNQRSVKDSMRDTYSVGIMKEYEEEILQEMRDSGCFDMEDGMYTLIPDMYDKAVDVYNAKLTEIFNRCDEKSVREVRETLLALKENVFGFEVDSGKDDIVKGLVGMNLAWSGDAVYSMDRGENEADNYIYYSVPKTGGNIWFDSWCIPKTSDAEHKAAAQDFLNFISDPIVAAANMETIGYTSFIAGETVHELIRLWYDPRSYAMYNWHDASGDAGCTWEDSDFLYREYDEEGNPLDENPDEDYGEQDILYLTGFDLAEDDVADFDFEQGILDMRGSTYAEPVVDGVAMTWDEYIEVYNAKVAEINALIEASGKDIELLEENEGWDIRDLTYMFEGTIDAGDTTSDDPALNNLLFYSDELETIADEEGNEVVVGRQFYAQYPDHNMIPKLAVMRDYGSNNIYVLKMWGDVKSNNLPISGVVIFGIVLAAAAAIILASVFTKKYYHKYRVARRKEVAQAARGNLKK